MRTAVPLLVGHWLYTYTILQYCSFVTHYCLFYWLSGEGPHNFEPIRTVLSLTCRPLVALALLQSILLVVWSRYIQLWVNENCLTCSASLWWYTLFYWLSQSGKDLHNFEPMRTVLLVVPHCGDTLFSIGCLSLVKISTILSQWELPNLICWPWWY